MIENWEITGIPIVLDNKLSPAQIKEKGYVNRYGKEIITEIVVGKEVYHKLEELYGDERDD